MESSREFAIHPQLAEFVDSASERLFRGSIADSEVRAFRLAMLISGPLYLLLIVSDYVELGLTPAFWTILAARVVVCGLALVYVGRIDGMQRSNADSVTRVYRYARWFFAISLSLAFVIYPLSGKSFVELYPGLIVMLMVGFFLIPARLIDRLVVGVIAVLIFNVEALFWLRIELHQLPMAWMLMLATLVLGGISARSSNLLRRQHFADHKQQQQLGIRLAEEAASRQFLQEEALMLANTDALTGIANRRYFLTVAEEELSRVRRDGGMLSVMLLDIDHFKQVNDRYGHGIGDEALTLVARTGQGMLRRQDRFGRMGGDEFVMLLPQTDVVGAMALASRLRVAVEGQRIDDEVQISVTIGVAGWLGGEDNLESMLRRADHALYEGKRGGRDCVVVAD